MKNVLKSLETIGKEVEKIKAELLAGEPTGDAGFDLEKLDGMKLAELKKVADDAGIEYAKSVKKDKLIEAILAYYEGEEEEEDEEEESDEEDEDEEEEEGYSEEDLEDMKDKELIEVAEEFELDADEFQTGKGKKKKLDRDALIEAILEAQDEDGEEDEDEDESDEDTLEFMDDEDLDELETEELKEHYNELVAYCDDKDYKLPKKAKVTEKAKDSAIKKAIIAIYDLIEAEEDEE